jgi:hypothetical protein
MAGGSKLTGNRGGRPPGLPGRPHANKQLTTLMFDWEAAKSILLSSSAEAIRSFAADLPAGEICAIGYIFELGNAHEQFDLCANTRSFYIQHAAEYRSAKYRGEFPNLSEEEIRWNSGDYEFPAGLPGDSYRTAWFPWSRVSEQLHQIAECDLNSDAVHNGLIRIGCESIAEIAQRGLLGDWSTIDFNVASVDCSIQSIMNRDREIRDLIAKRSR